MEAPTVGFDQQDRIEEREIPGPKIGQFQRAWRTLECTGSHRKERLLKLGGRQGSGCQLAGGVWTTQLNHRIRGQLDGGDDFTRETLARRRGQRVARHASGHLCQLLRKTACAYKKVQHDLG